MISSERSTIDWCSSASTYAWLTSSSSRSNTTFALGSPIAARLNWRFSSECTSGLGERGDGHGLVVQFAARVRRERRDLTVRVETGHHRGLAEDCANGLDFFVDALAEHELATDAADQDRQLRAIRGRRPRRVGRA